MENHLHTSSSTASHLMAFPLAQSHPIRMIVAFRNAKLANTVLPREVVRFQQHVSAAAQQR
jgi:hypothetical protein